MALIETARCHCSEKRLRAEGAMNLELWRPVNRSYTNCRRLLREVLPMVWALSKEGGTFAQWVKGPFPFFAH